MADNLPAVAGFQTFGRGRFSAFANTPGTNDCSDCDSLRQRISADGFHPRAILLPQGRTRGHSARIPAGAGWNSRVADLASRLFPGLRPRDGSCSAIRFDRRNRRGWLVSCEGAHSVVRKQAGIAFQDVPVGFLWPMCGWKERYLTQKTTSGFIQTVAWLRCRYPQPTRGVSSSR
jgi:hypothetical protein